MRVEKLGGTHFKIISDITTALNRKFGASAGRGRNGTRENTGGRSESVSRRKTLVEAREVSLPGYMDRLGVLFPEAVHPLFNVLSASNLLTR